MPEPSDEFLGSVARANYSKSVTMHVKYFLGKLRMARTLLALDALKRDILRSDLVTNFQAIEELRRVANVRAKELKFKGQCESEEWWK